MASPASHDADEATENFLDSIIVSSSQRSEHSIENDCDSAPPSPELGMGREGENEVGDLELDKADDQVVADADLSDMSVAEQQGDNAAFESKESGEPVERLPRSRQTQQSPPESAHRASADAADSQLITPAPTCPPTRRSARAKNTLMYDQKYHPMDDIIRPSQAAKRRSLHGERSVLARDSDGEDSEESYSDIGSIDGDEDSDDEESQQPTRGHKRKRSRPRTPEPTRRSSRRRTKPKVSYNMKIHPQDGELKQAGACDGSKSSPSPTKQVSSNEVNTLTIKTPSDDFNKACRSLHVDELEDSSVEPASKPFPVLSTYPIPVLQPATKQSNKIVDVYPDLRRDLRPDIAYLSGDQDVWPAVKGLPFHIFTEHIEDQLNAEAEAASPFHYEDDDKENDVTNPELVPRPNPLDGISIIPASHYRRTPGLYTLSDHSSIASNAFYVHPHFEASPYGLGWSDGAHDIHSSDTNDCFVPDYMRILASGESLSRASSSAENRHSRGDNVVVSSSPVRSLEDLELLR